MHLTLPNLNLTPQLEGGGGMASAPQEVAGSVQSFPTALKDAQGSEPAALVSEVVTSLAPITGPGQELDADAQTAALPESLLQLVSVLLRTMLAKSSQCDAGKPVAIADTPKPLPVQTPDTNDRSDCTESDQVDHPSLIEHILAAVLTALQTQIQKITRAAAEDSSDTNSSHNPADRLQALVTTMVRRFVEKNAQEFEVRRSTFEVLNQNGGPVTGSDDLISNLKPRTSNSNGAEATHKLTTEFLEHIQRESMSAEGTEPIQQVATELVEHFKTVLRNAGHPTLPPTGNSASPIRTTQDLAAVSSPSPEATPQNRWGEAFDDLVMEPDVQTTTREASGLAARDEGLHHQQGGRTDEHGAHPEPELRQTETYVRFAVKDGDATPIRTDRSPAGAARQSVSPQWQEYDPTPTHPSVHLEVSPPDIGRVRLHVALAGERVYANVITEHPGVRDFLLAEQPRLEGGLSARGMEMGGFQVAVEQQERGGRDYRDHWPWMQSVREGAESRQRPVETEVESWSIPNHRGIEMRALSVFA